MKVYHASTVIVAHPDTVPSRKFLDFGSGFYVTDIKEQAINYGQRFIRRNHEAWINIYEMKEDFTNLKVITFDAYDEQWLDFITECRTGEMHGEWDIVRGGIANDKVFRTLDLFFSGDIGKHDALRRLKYEKPNHQICFRSEEALKQCLTFINACRL